MADKTDDRYKTEDMLFGEDDHKLGRKIYRPDFHPGDIVEYFSERYDQLRDPERFETPQRLEHVTSPIRPPTLAGYSARLYIGRSTLWKWRKKYPEFEEAVGVCKEMQEDMIIFLSSCGAYNAGFAALMAKNMFDDPWKDKVEADMKGTVELKFDQQDEDA